MKLFRVSRANAIRLGLLSKHESAARKAKPESGEKRPVPAPEKPKAVNVAKAKLERAREAILGAPAPVEPPLAPAIKANAQIVAKAVGVKLGAPMTFEQGNGMKGNPNYGKSRSFSVNCQSCVVANELRRRGMDVKATGFDESNSFQNFIRARWNLLWETPAGKPPKIRVLTNSKNSINESLESAMVENGRYFVVVAWKNEVTGHIFCAERVNGGELLFYDPQNGAKGDAVREYFSRAKRSAWCFRVDDCMIAKNYVSSLSSVISPRS